MKLSGKKSMTPAAKERRKSAIERLEKQLSSGMKPNNEKLIPQGLFSQGIATLTMYRKKYPTLPLTHKDIDRISKEIEVLKTRI